MTFAQKILQFHRELTPDWQLPEGVELLYPFDNEATWEVMEAFFPMYFSDKRERTLILGINPGRFGAGLTGTPFTDPVVLEEVCGITNPFPKKRELSAIFVYAFIDAYGGPDSFYRDFYITSVCPLGFVRDGKNYNYYDSKPLTRAVEPYIIENIRTNLDFGCNRKVAFCMGQGKNYKYLSKLNAEQGFFQDLIPLPHPRWVMQYRRKQMTAFTDRFVEALNSIVRST